MNSQSIRTQRTGVHAVYRLSSERRANDETVALSRGRDKTFVARTYGARNALLRRCRLHAFTRYRALGHQANRDGIAMQPPTHLPQVYGAQRRVAC